MLEKRNINKFVLGKRGQFVYTLQNLSEKNSVLEVHHNGDLATLTIKWYFYTSKTTKMKLNWWQILYMKTLLYQTNMHSYIIQNKWFVEISLIGS